jgi:hypothetical protein
MFTINSPYLNAAAEAMWKWEQTRRTDKSLYQEARRYITEYCQDHNLPVAELLLDAMQITVRIANGFPPNTGVVSYDDDEHAVMLDGDLPL